MQSDASPEQKDGRWIVWRVKILQLLSVGIPALPTPCKGPIFGRHFHYSGRICRRNEFIIFDMIDGLTRNRTITLIRLRGGGWLSYILTYEKKNRPWKRMNIISHQEHPFPFRMFEMIMTARYDLFQRRSLTFVDKTSGLYCCSSEAWNIHKTKTTWENLYNFRSVCYFIF